MEKYCPNCGTKYKWYESECPKCRVPLVDVPDAEQPNPKTELVTVLETTETGVLPLARIALEQAGIEYAVQNLGFADQIMGSRTSMTVGETDTPLHIVVRAEDESRALDVLRDLTTPGAAVVSAPGIGIPARAAGRGAAAAGGGAVELTDAESGAPIGRISESQFASLASHLELESTADDDYYLDAATLALLEEQGADAEAVALLRAALGSRSDITIRWRR